MPKALVAQTTSMSPRMKAVSARERAPASSPAC